jgi:hypothetical protein
MRYGRVGNVTDQQHVDMWVKVSYFPFLFFFSFISFFCYCALDFDSIMYANMLQTIGQAADFLRRTKYVLYWIRIPSYILVISRCHIYAMYYYYPPIIKERVFLKDLPA